MARKALLAFIAFLAIAVATLYHSSFSTLTPSDLIKMKEAYGVAVQGRVEGVFFENGLTHFYISDDLSKVRAVYDGLIDSKEIIAIGDWKGEIFYVRDILKKCHTEYGG